MKDTVLRELKSEVAAWISSVSGTEISENNIRIPAREAMISCSAFVRTQEKIEDVVRLLNENRHDCSVKEVWKKNGWILINLDSAFYVKVVESFSNPDALPEGQSYCYYKMRMLTRHPGSDCPDEPEVHKAILRCLVYQEEPTAAHLKQAEEALLSMSYRKKPADRQQLLIQCGDVARAAIRLLYR